MRPTRPSRAARPETEPPPVSYLHDDADESRRLRVALVVAVVVHALLLAVPTLESEAVPPAEEERNLIEIKPVRFKPPPPPPPEQPQPEPQAVEIPVPDPTPFEPEPILEVEETPPLPRIPEWPVDVVIPDGPPPPPEPTDTGPILVGGDVARPVGIHTPKPAYTEMARRARIQGPVILQVTLDETGEVVRAEVLRGLPMGLTESAERTVRQWRYHPATLNGKPVSVYMTITVHFTLN